MEQVDLKQYGFIASVNLCITLLEEFGSKLTPELLNEYLGEQTKIYMSSDEFLKSVVSAVQNGGDDFLAKMQELYAIKDEILKVIEPYSLIKIIEGQAQKVCEEKMMQESFIKALADFVLSEARFRDYLYSYTKQVVRKAISELDVEVIVSDLVKENADKYAQSLLESTKQKNLHAEASLLVIQQIEKYCISKCTSFFDPDKLHPQFKPKQGGSNE